MKKKSKLSKKAAKKAEIEFLANYDASLYPHPSVSVDVALFTVDDGKLKVLLTHRDHQPALGKWSLPGTFVGIFESLNQAASRALATKTGVSGIFLEQLYTFGQPDRDPRTRVITVAYYALVHIEKLRRMLNEDPNIQLIDLVVPWSGEKGGKVQGKNEAGKKVNLAFDHDDIVGLVVKRLRGKLSYAPIGFELLPKKFTLRQLQSIHETILGKRKNKDSFRRSLIASGLIAATGELESSVGHRPAELYRFKRKTERK